MPGRVVCHKTGVVSEQNIQSLRVHTDAEPRVQREEGRVCKRFSSDSETHFALNRVSGVGSPILGERYGMNLNPISS